MSTLEVVYVLEKVGLSGGIKNVIEQVNRLHQSGVKVHLFALDGQPTWFPLHIKIRSFASYTLMFKELKSMHAIKIATWWKTLPVVWNSCDPNQGGQGVPLYLVQDIEESYYPNLPDMQERVRQTYRLPVRMLTIADWTTNELLHRFRQHATNISIAVDLDMFKPNRTHDYDPYRILACSRKSQHLKGFEVTVRAIQGVCKYVPQASLVTFGIEPPRIKGISNLHFARPTDESVSNLYANCGVFVQTSYHEGFGLPIVEAMACGAPVVTTKAEGNEEFCKNGWNCVLVDKGDATGVMNGIIRILQDPEFGAYIAANAVETAQLYNWPRVMHNLTTVFNSLTPQTI
ncbi:glycosyltransferase family 4 protein [Paenibacillus sp. ACRRX]|uniref:glycosyltransferase family 4 protein n=1 Tax=Paenibacillus sp. ACRRX TaxID=2918206 RepID=UPI001EF3D7E8|nr:glycosyltransferase family 4 protein [Paenibacillus sp. ACRRX]MCG7410366.1 glycosyltransferase family 4 protein [Paenibacillus sp. ACRRX]